MSQKSPFQTPLGQAVSAARQLQSWQQQQQLANQYSKQQMSTYATTASALGGFLAEEEREPVKKTTMIDLGVNAVSKIVENVLSTDIVPFLWGPPGIGKSTLVKDIAKNKNWKLIDLRLSLLSPVDLRGLPVIDKINKQAIWLPPEFLPKENEKEKGILFLDEINLAPPSVQAAAYQLILDKQVGSYKFPSTWKIIAAGNRETDRANVYKLSAPLANRFIHFNVVPNLGQWRNWARQNNIRPEIIDFLSGRPAFLFQQPKEEQKAFASPRTWAFLSQLMTGFAYNEEIGISDELKQVIIGTIGDSVGQEFISHLSDYNVQKISSLVDELTKTGNITLPKQLSLRYAVITAVFDAYLNGRLSGEYYKKFCDKLSGEEKKTVEVFEKERGEDLKVKNIIHKLKPNKNVENTHTITSIKKNTEHIALYNARLINSKYAMLYDDNNLELISISVQSHLGLDEVKRGMYGTVARDWPAGTKIQPIKYDNP